MLDQVLVGLAQHVRVHLFPTQSIEGKMLYQINEELVRELVFIAPLGITENAGEKFLVGLLYTAQGLFDSQTDIGAGFPNILPVAGIRDCKAMHFRQGSVFFIALGFLQGDTDSSS